ncbi:hypothetical protein MM236_01880 [Belliella sp. DSM 107340]|uniref:CHRD domain-containing protein n=1 Tax=Belliella calami TaxID=2923436 RepID=A0ABS9UJB6_9BACT|nr:hypothetical protein [Belliella calami]MCH7396712.1 hypothetical protein [Belliella calami]
MRKLIYLSLIFGLFISFGACSDAPTLDKPNTYEVNFPTDKYEGVIPDGEISASYVDADLGSGLIRTISLSFMDGDLSVVMLVMMNGNQALPIRGEDEEFGSFVIIDTLGENPEGRFLSIQGTVSATNIKATALSASTGFLTGDFSFSGQFVKALDPDGDRTPVTGQVSFE